MSSTPILLGLTAGIVVGLVVGERAAALQVFADAYIKLLQMTVLPYVTLSLIAGFGSLNRSEAMRLGTRVGLVLVGLWAVALVAVFAFPVIFPVFESASFFSTTLLEQTEPLDLLGLYIPANPFNSLANNVVPAVVLFSALLGLALISVPGRRSAVEAIDALRNAVARVARSVVWLAPYGLFAIAAVTAGTFDPAQAAQLEIYIAGYVLVSLLLTFWVLPGLVAALTPIPHRRLLSSIGQALILAFSTGSLFVVLPMLTEQTRDLLRAHTHPSQHQEGLPDVIIPTSFNFPHSAKLLTLTFVLFAAWFSGASLSPAHYPSLAAMGVLVLFGSVNVAVPFLLDFFHVPADTFQLFLATSVVNARFGTILSAVHTVAVALLGSCAVMGVLRFDARKLVRFAAITLVAGAATLGGTRAIASRVVAAPYNKDQVLAAMHVVRQADSVKVFREPAPPLPAFAGSLVERIHQRGVLRVGYFDDSLPYAFFNGRGDLVGFDVEMALQFAEDLQVGVEFVPLDRRVLTEGLDASACDLVMSGAVVTADRALRVMLSAPYLDETLAFLVPDHARAAFSSWDLVRDRRPLRLALPRGEYYERKIKNELPGAELVTFDDISSMFGANRPAVDALVLTAERGSAYTLLHPEYSVAVPKPRLLKVPLAYVIAGRDQPLATLVGTWIELKRRDGTIDELFARWILGREAVRKARRWSVLDNLLAHRK